MFAYREPDLTLIMHKSQRMYMFLPKVVIIKIIVNKQRIFFADRGAETTCRTVPVFECLVSNQSGMAIYFVIVVPAEETRCVFDDIWW